MNSTAVKDGLTKVYWGMILALVGDMLGTEAYGKTVVLSPVTAIAAIISLVGLLLILMGLRFSAEVSTYYKKARAYVVFDMGWQITAAVLAGIGLSATPTMDSVVSIVADILTIRAILAGNEAVCRLVGANTLGGKAKKISTFYTVSAILAMVGSLGFIAAVLVGAIALPEMNANIVNTFYASLGLAGIVILVIAVLYCLSYFDFLRHFRKTAMIV